MIITEIQKKGIKQFAAEHCDAHRIIRGVTWHVVGYACGTIINELIDIIYENQKSKK